MDETKTDPATALLTTIREAAERAEREDPGAAMWLRDVLAVATRAMPLIRAHSLREMSARLADHSALPWGAAVRHGLEIRRGLIEASYQLNLLANEIEANHD